MKDDVCGFYAIRAAILCLSHTTRHVGTSRSDTSACGILINALSDSP